MVSKKNINCYKQDYTFQLCLMFHKLDLCVSSEQDYLLLLVQMSSNLSFFTSADENRSSFRNAVSENAEDVQ
jgi:hypothetical protein